ncbi:ubiquitin carboxyl-terminal hydrolase-like [Pomacea canaliculata]|uniref:ubiquitin carboxyl-terminal hydrolase-like n=1 Tax=Pomacea canaliculata TaxID=400727 RepID=UPI000D7280F1|nr:ubiquitin carboxyl-terminal hydrolase-like [Pomacea canaliculata]
MASQRWIPLESNPKVLNKYIQNLGVSNDWQFVDVYGLDDEMLMMVPGPQAAVMLLYPLTENAKTKEIGTVDSSYPSSAYYLKQTIGNACGTVALVHALANNEDKITFDETKHFRKFLNETKNATPEERAKFLENDQEMGSAHEESAQEGDTEAPSRDVSVNPHFVTFVNVDGNLYEMDGRKEAPVNHGKTSSDTLLQDTVKVVREFMARDPDEINFTLMVLAKVNE